jgi:hypothetical protein
MFATSFARAPAFLVLGNDEHYIMNLRDEMMSIFEFGACRCNLQIARCKLQVAVERVTSPNPAPSPGARDPRIYEVYEVYGFTALRLFNSQCLHLCRGTAVVGIRARN